MFDGFLCAYTRLLAVLGQSVIMRMPQYVRMNCRKLDF